MNIDYRRNIQHGQHSAEGRIIARGRSAIEQLAVSLTHLQSLSAGRSIFVSTRETLAPAKADGTDSVDRRGALPRFHAQS
jgi:hypothetical protein